IVLRPLPPPHLHSLPARRSPDLDWGLCLYAFGSTAWFLRHADHSGNSLVIILQLIPALHRDPLHIGIASRSVRLWHTPCGSVRRSEEHTSELQSRFAFVCRLLLE